MSRVTTVTLVLDDSQTSVEGPLSDGYTDEDGRLVNFVAMDFSSANSTGTKYPDAPVCAGGFNHLDWPKCEAWLRSLEWGDVSAVAVVSGPNCDPPSVYWFGKQG